MVTEHIMHVFLVIHIMENMDKLCVLDAVLKIFAYVNHQEEEVKEKRLKNEKQIRKENLIEKNKQNLKYYYTKHYNNIIIIQKIIFYQLSSNSSNSSKVNFSRSSNILIKLSGWYLDLIFGSLI